MAFGKVKSWNPKKGWGFIIGENPDPTSDVPTADYFVHYEHIRGEGHEKNLDPGRHVEFKPVRVGKGLQARDVHYPEEEILTLPVRPAKVVRS